MLVDTLRQRGHEAIHADEIGLARATDQEVLEWARRDGSVVITADLDFPRLLVLGLATRPGLVLFRGGNYSDREMAHLPGRALDTVSPELLTRSICVVDRRKIRVTELPVADSK